MKERRRRDAAAMNRRFRSEILQPVICEIRPTETWQSAADGSHPAGAGRLQRGFMSSVDPRRGLQEFCFQKDRSFILKSEARPKETSAGRASRLPRPDASASFTLRRKRFYLVKKTHRGRLYGQKLLCSSGGAETSFNFLQSHHC